MRRTNPNSRLEIWDAMYINDISKRMERDKNVDIIQIERGVTGRDYIVEVVDKGGTVNSKPITPVYSC